MKAVIMAGGEGNRLRPLTCDLPKPMARLCGRPILEYILDLLALHGVEEASLTLRYLPDRIVRHFPGERYKNIRLRFVEEDRPLGTAGSVRNACSPEDDGVLVISGDALCDFDLAAFAAFHRRSGADVTILGTRVADPREYGLINADAEGRIVGFIEKPAFSQAISDIANTGIYLLSRSAVGLIPEEAAFDFAKDLFPLMLGKGMKLMCWQGSGYWCDIGDLATFIRCQQDILEGRVSCEVKGSRDKSGNLFGGEVPAGRLRLEAPVYIGGHVRIEESALIERGSVIDDGCYIGPGARVSGSVLLQDCYVGARAKLTGALCCAAATVKAGAMLFEGATVGASAVIGEKASVQAGVKIWNKKNIQESSVVAQHVKTGSQAQEQFDDDGLTGQIGVELTPEFCARVGAAVGSLRPGSRVAVGCSTHSSAAVLKAALSAGIQSTGSHVIDFGENFQAQFEYSMNFASAPIGVYIKGDNRAYLRVLGPGGLPAPRETERGIEGILSRGEFVRCPHDQMGDKVEMSGLGMLYRSQLLRFAPKGLSGCRVLVKSRNLAVQSTLKETLCRLGADTSEGLGVEVSSQGDKVRMFDPELGYIPHHKILAFCAVGEMERGGDVALPFDAPQVIDRMAEALGRRVHRYFTCPADCSDEEARKLARAQMWSRDALMQAVLFLHIARQRGGLEALLRSVPSFDRATRTLETAGNPAGLLRRLGIGEGGAITEGVLLRRERGVVLVKPLKRGTGLRIFAEAVSSEIAGELCADVEELLRKKEAESR